MKIFKFLKSFFKRKRVIELSVVEYDKLLDSKLEKIYSCTRPLISARDSDMVFGVEVNNPTSSFRDGQELFDKQVLDAYSLYVINLKKELAKKHNIIKNNIITISPIHVLWIKNYDRHKHHKLRNFIGKINSIKFKIGTYYKYIICMFKIYKIKKLYPHMSLSNKRVLGIIRAVELNNRMIKLNKLND